MTHKTALEKGQGHTEQERVTHTVRIVNVCNVYVWLSIKRV